MDSSRISQRKEMAKINRCYEGSYNPFLMPSSEYVPILCRSNSTCEFHLNSFGQSQSKISAHRVKLCGVGHILSLWLRSYNLFSFTSWNHFIEYNQRWYGYRSDVQKLLVIPQFSQRDNWTEWNQPPIYINLQAPIFILESIFSHCAFRWSGHECTMLFENAFCAQFAHTV